MGLAAQAEGLPDTVHEAVLERLDRLAADERGVLQVAAVAGRTFRPDDAAGNREEGSEERMEAALGGLLTRDLIAPAEDGTVHLPPHPLPRRCLWDAATQPSVFACTRGSPIWLETPPPSSWTSSPS